MGNYQMKLFVYLYRFSCLNISVKEYTVIGKKCLSMIKWIECFTTALDVKVQFPDPTGMYMFAVMFRCCYCFMFSLKTSFVII